MGTILTDSQNYTDIANAIRAKKNVATTYKPNEMAAAIANIDLKDQFQTKSVSPTVLVQEITPDDGYDGLSKVTVSGMPIGMLSNLTVNSTGLVTATVGASGYLGSGTTARLQLTKQAGKVITPGTSNQTAVESGKFTTGSIIVAGDADLVSANIKQGANIFGVAGSLEMVGGSGLTWGQLTSKTWGVVSNPRRNIFNLAFCQFEPNITNHLDINDYGSTFTVQSGSTSGNAVYFMLDPDAIYDLSWTSQNCSLFGYSDSWNTIIEETSDGQHTLSNITNVHYCYFTVRDASSSLLTGTFQDVVIYEA